MKACYRNNMANRRGKGGSVTNFLFLGSKITADGDCSHAIRRRLLLNRKVVANLGSVSKTDYSANKGPYIQGNGLPSRHVQL